MTMVEIMIAGTIMAALVLVAMTVAMTSRRAAGTELVTTGMEWQARELLRRFASELREARPPQPFSNQSSILFQRNTGVVNGQVVWGPDIVYAWAAEQGEVVNNGIDDNLNNLVDEGALQRTEAGVATVICRGLAPNNLLDAVPDGLTFTSDATGITMSLTLMKLDDGKLIQRSYTTKVVPRN